MNESRKNFLAACLPASVFALCFGMAAQAQDAGSLPIDQPTQVKGVETACTGIGNREENEARWRNYPAKLEVVGDHGQWLADETVSVDGNGQALQVNCEAPWVLMRLEPGRYHATVRIPDAAPKHISFTVPQEGQRDVIVRFPTGEQSS